MNGQRCCAIFTLIPSFSQCLWTLSSSIFSLLFSFIGTHPSSSLFCLTPFVSSLLANNLLSLSSLSCILKHFLNKYTVGICEHLTNKSFRYSWQERERKKGGSKEGEWEMGEALAARKQSWCCWFHWVYWERRATRVTSANNTELQSQEVCVCEYTCEAFVSLHLSFSSTFCWVLKDSKRDRK